MFVKSYKISGRRLIAIGVMCLAVIGFIVYGIGTRLSHAEGAERAEVETRAGGRTTKGIAKTEADRQAYILQFGWQVGGEPLEMTEIVIPEEFDDVYTRYNELQKQQGFDLEKYKGKRAKQYTYMVTNYPDTKQEIHLSLLVQDGRVIAGDVSSTALGGFMQGLAKDSAVLDTAELETSVQEHSTLAEEEAPIEETMAAELAAMEEALRDNIEEQEKPPVTEAQMPTD